MLNSLYLLKQNPVETRSALNQQNIQVGRGTAPVQTRALIPDSLQPIQDSVHFGSQNKPKPLTYKHIQTVNVDGLGQAEVYQFNNGLKLYALQRDNLPLFSYGVLIKAGASRETEQTSGLAHFLEHLIFKGSHNIPADSVSQKFENAGAQLNALTYYDETFFHCAYAPKQALDPVINTFADIIQNPAFRPNEIDNERGSVLDEERRQADDPFRTASDTGLRHLFAKLPYHRTSMGKRENIQGPHQVSRDDIREYHRQWYVPNNMAILVTGQFDPKEVLDKVAHAHNQTAPGKIQEHPPKPQDAPWSKKELRLERNDIEQAILTYTAPGPEPHAPNDAKELAAWRLLMSILTEGNSSRLYQRLVEQEQVASDIFEFVPTYTRFARAGDWHIMAVPEQTSTVQKLVKDEIRKIAEKGIEPEELRSAQVRWENGMAETCEDQEFSLINFAFAVSHDTLNQAFGNQKEAIQSVTPKDIQAAAKKYLASDKMVLTQTLPVDHQTTEHLESTPVTDNKGIKFGGKLAKPDQSFPMPGGGEVLIREIPEAKRTAITLMLRGGNALEKTPGEMALLGKLIGRRTAHYTPTELQKTLNEDGLELRIMNGPDWLTVSLVGLPYFKEKMFKLLQEVVLNPNFQQKDLDFIKKLAVENYKTEVGFNKEGVLSERLAQELFPGSHPYNHCYKISELPQTALSRLGEITPDRMAQLHRQTFTQANATVSIAGNLDKTRYAESATQSNRSTYSPSELAKKITTIINELPADSKQHPIPPAKPVQGDKTIRIPQNGSNQSVIVRGWQGPSVHSPDYAAMRMLQTIMTGAGISARVFQAFRGADMDALAYAPMFQYRPFESGGMAWYVVGTDAKHTQTVLEKIGQETERLLTTLPSAEEMNIARLHLETTLPLKEESTYGSARYLAQHRGFGQLSTNELLKQIQAVTPQQIREVAQKYLAKPSVTCIQASPSVLATLPEDNNSRVGA